MRKIFVCTDQSYSYARRYFRRWFPWVEVVARATGGYWGFECRQDYRFWRRVKLRFFMRKLTAICKRLRRLYHVQFAVNRCNRRYYVYVFDIDRSDWFLDGWFDRLADVEDFLIHSESYWR